MNKHTSQTALIKLVNAIWTNESMGIDYMEFINNGYTQDMALMKTLDRHPGYRYSMSIALESIERNIIIE